MGQYQPVTSSVAAPYRATLLLTLLLTPQPVSPPACNPRKIPAAPLACNRCKLSAFHLTHVCPGLTNLEPIRHPHRPITAQYRHGPAFSLTTVITVTIFPHQATHHIPTLSRLYHKLLPIVTLAHTPLIYHKPHSYHVPAPHCLQTKPLTEEN